MNSLKKQVCMKCGKFFKEYEVACWECGGSGCKRCKNSGMLVEVFLCEACYEAYRKQSSVLRNSDGVYEEESL